MTMRARDDSAADTLDLAELARAARRGGGFILGFTLAGIAAAGAVLLAGPRRFEAASSIVVRSSSGSRSSLLSKLAGADGAAGLLDGGSSSPLETEIQILSSRELIGRVVDSLHLQVQVRAPSGVASNALVQAVDLPGSFKPRKYTVSFLPGGTTRVRGSDTVVTAPSGQSIMLPIGRLSFNPAAHAHAGREYALQLFDREDAISRLAKQVAVSKPGRRA